MRRSFKISAQTRPGAWKRCERVRARISKIVDNRFERSLNRITLVSLSSASKVYFHNPV